MTPRAPSRSERAARAEDRGRAAEDAAATALIAAGWAVLARRLRTTAGEIDIIVERDGLLAFIEVKARASLAEAALALAPRQRRRLLAAAEIVLAEHPGWGRAGVRFDVIVVDRGGRLRRISDAFRAEE